jgi:hypothetical protein
MTQDEIIEMARQAGFDCYLEEITWDDVICTEELEVFAKLVAAKAFQNGYEKGIAAFNDAVLLEREACANMVDHILKEGGGTYGDAIRIRGQA